MPRTYYETSATLSAEKRVAEIIEQRWKAVLHKLPISYRVDFCASREKQIVSWIEIKCRSHPAGQYPTIMLSVSKWQAGLQLHQATGVPFVFVAAFSCGSIRYCEAITTDVSVEYGGRTLNRRDNEDVEPVVMIPVASMKVL